MTVKVTIVDPVNPVGGKVGGRKTFIRGFMKYAPDDFEIEFVGLESGSGREAPGRWRECEIGGRSVRLYPLFREADENRKRRIPLSLRYTLALRRRDIDYEGRVIVFNTIEPAIAFRRIEAPKIVFIHNDITRQVMSRDSGILWSRIPWAYSLTERYIFSYLDFVYTVSMKTLEHYRAGYPAWKDKMAFMPTWVDPGVFNPGSATKADARRAIVDGRQRRIGADAVWILFAGRLQKQKSPRRLIDVFAEFHRRRPGSEFLIVGDGNMREETESYARDAGLAGNVHFLGSVSQETLAGLYRASDVFLLASLYEGMPMSVLEALGCGLPVVSTDVGEVGRVVRDGVSGRIVREFSVDDACAAIEDIVTQRGRYGTEDCVSSIGEFTVASVLEPVYGKIRALHDAKYGKG